MCSLEIWKRAWNTTDRSDTLFELTQSDVLTNPTLSAARQPIRRFCVAAVDLSAFAIIGVILCRARLDDSAADTSLVSVLYRRLVVAGVNHR